MQTAADKQPGRHGKNRLELVPGQLDGLTALTLVLQNVLFHVYFLPFPIKKASQLRSNPLTVSSPQPIPDWAGWCYRPHMAKSKQKHEYRILRFAEKTQQELPTKVVGRIEDRTLNEQAKQGWELVACFPTLVDCNDKNAPRDHPEQGVALVFKKPLNDA
jgi:hypothetical protein